MAIDRTTVLRGPCAVTWNYQGTSSITFFTKDDVSIVTDLETKPIKVSAYGSVIYLVSGRSCTLSVTPVGFAIGNKEELWPYGATACGTSLINAGSATADSVLTIIGSAGDSVAITGAYITQMPGFSLTSQDTVMKAMTFKSIGKKNEAWTETGNLYTYTATGVSFPTSFDSSDVITSTFTGAWGSVTGFTALDSAGGWDIDFNMGTQELRSDTYGVFDEILTDLTVTVKAKLMGPSVAQLHTAMKFQGSGAMVMGKNIATQQSATLTITGAASGAPIVALTNAAMTKATLAYGWGDFRISDCEFISARTVASGVTTSQFTITAQS